MTLLRSPALPRILPFAAYILLLAVEQIPGVQFGSQAANWMYAARAGAAGLLLLWCWRSYSELRGTWPASTQWLLAVAVDAKDFLAIRPQTVSLRAVLITSALFALEHHLVVAGFVAGLVYSWLYVRTGRLWVPIAAHAVTNGVLGVWVIQTGAWGLW